MTPWAEAALYRGRARRARRARDPARRSSAGRTSSATATSIRLSPTRASRAGSAIERVLELNLTVTRGLVPDRTFLVLLDPAEARRRGAGEPDRIEREGDDSCARRRGVPRARRGEPGADRRPRRRSAAPRRSRRRSVSTFVGFSEHPEAARLLEAALREGPAHAYLFHGPPASGSARSRGRSRGRCSARRASSIRTCTSSMRWAR